MVPAADVVGGLDKRFIFIAAQTVQHVRAHNGVRFHKIELLRGKPPGLVQDLIAYRNLSDVVQRRCHNDQLLRFGRQVILVGFLRQPLQKALGQRADVQHVLAALAVAELDDLAQDRDHHLGVFLFFLDLARHQRGEPPLLGVELDRVENAAVDDARIERAADIVRDAQLVGVAHNGVGVLARDHDDGDVLDPVAAVHLAQHRKAVHDRHDDVQQDQRNAGAVLLQHGQAFPAVRRLQNVVVAAQDLRQNGAVHLGVVHN